MYGVGLWGYKPTFFEKILQMHWGFLLADVWFFMGRVFLAGAYVRTAMDDVTLAMGYGCFAIAYGCFAMGYGWFAMDYGWFAMGYGCFARGYGCFAMNYGMTARGYGWVFGMEWMIG